MNSAATNQSVVELEGDKASPVGESVGTTRARVREIFTRHLSHIDRLLVILWYVEEMTPDEIALAIDSTPDSVRANHARIVQQLG